jgi:hypothetical protein
MGSVKIFNHWLSKINNDEKSKSIRKYAFRTITLEKQNNKTSKIA